MQGASSLLFMAACAVVLLYSTSFSHGMPSTPPAPTTSTSAGVSAQTLLKVASSLKMYVDQLPTMPKVYGYKTQNGKLVPHALTIGMYAKKWKFHRDLPPTPVFVYGTSPTTATFPGPTIYARQGMELPITWKNFLPQKHILPWDPTIPTAIPKHGGVPTVVHLHGSVHPPKYDGSAFAWFTKDFKETGPFWSTTTYNYPNVQPPGNLWYHDHALGLTRVNILAGLLGAYVIQKPSIDDVLELPKGAEYDQHLFICDRSFNKDGSIYMNHTGVYPPLHPQWRPEYLGEAVTVNGKAWPYLSVKSRKYRFRIINASNARFFNLSLSDGLPFYIIGSDASYLSAPVRATSVLLSTFEAADILVDFSTTTLKSIELVNNAAHPFPKGPPASPATAKVMRFIVQPMGETDPPDTSIVPREEVTYAKVKSIDVTAAKTRYVTMNEYVSPTGETTHLYLNGKKFEDPVTETPKTGSSEIWHIINPTGDNHPLHLHLGMFQAIHVQEIVNLKTFVDCMSKFNDAVKCNIAGHSVGRVLPIPEHEKTWKNVVKIEPGYVTTILIQFKIVDTDMSYPFDATAEPGYVYHCHILDHEDNVMIRPLKLMP